MSFQLDLSFGCQPPADIRPGCIFPDPTLVSFAAYTHTHTTRQTPWIFGPEDSLHFVAEFIPLGAGSSASDAVRPFRSHSMQVIDFSNQQLQSGDRWVGFWLTAIDVPGNYHLQISGYFGSSTAPNPVMLGCIAAEIKVTPFSEEPTAESIEGQMFLIEAFRNVENVGPLTRYLA
jgi:hypothetical protein